MLTGFFFSVSKYKYESQFGTILARRRRAGPFGCVNFIRKKRSFDRPSFASASQKYLIRHGKLAKWMFINAYYKQHLAPCRTGHPALCLNVLGSFSRWKLHVSFSLTSFSFAIWMVAEEKVLGKDWNNTKKRGKILNGLT